MRKWTSQISLALVCAVLGFTLAYQFKAILKKEKILNVNQYTANTANAEIEQYKKDKEGLNKKIEELQTKLNDYESAAAGNDDTTKKLLTDLEETRLLTGTTDVQGEGIIVYLIPSQDIFGNNGGMTITDRHLVYLVNELRFAGAEAISINDIRLTLKSGIRISGSTIIINGEDRVSPSQKITIKAIGDKKNLEASLNFPETLSDFKGISEVKYEVSDNIKVQKYNKAYKFNYAKPVEKENKK